MRFVVQSLMFGKSVAFAVKKIASNVFYSLDNL